jgi:hypothetical protein
MLGAVDAALTAELQERDFKRPGSSCHAGREQPACETHHQLLL